MAAETQRRSGSPSASRLSPLPVHLSRHGPHPEVPLGAQNDKERASGRRAQGRSRRCRAGFRLVARLRTRVVGARPRRGHARGLPQVQLGLHQGQPARQLLRRGVRREVRPARGPPARPDRAGRERAGAPAPDRAAGRPERCLGGTARSAAPDRRRTGGRSAVYADDLLAARDDEPHHWLHEIRTAPDDGEPRRAARRS